jgi:hypothetical protein
LTGGGTRRSTRLGVFLALLILLVPLAVYVWGRNSSAFAVERIRISGTRRVATAKAAATLRARFLGRNLFTVQADDVAAALRRFPYFADVEVDRDFPSTLRVRIVEYRPAAVLFSAGRWFIVSRGGRVLVRLPGEVPRPQGAKTNGKGGERPTAGASGGSGTSAWADTAAKASWATGSSPASGVVSTGSRSSTATGQSPKAPAEAGTDAVAAASADAAAAQVAAAISSGSLGTPVGAASLFEGDLSAQSLTGVVLPRQARRLPVLLTSDKVKVGDAVDDRYARDALAVLAILPPARRARVRFVSSSPSGIDVVLRSGATYVFGDGSDLVNKELALQAVLAAYRRHHLHATWVDVSVPNRPLGTPVIVNRLAPLQSVRPTPKPTAPKVQSSPAPSGKPSAGPSVSASSAQGSSPSSAPRPSASARAGPSPSTSPDGR